jgi:serine/threonine protein kinase/Flp pilus assembly protein TadD
MQTNSPLSPGTTIGRYEIRSQIGAGGMGEVFLARDTQLDRTVALKILPEAVAADQTRLQRFIQEAKSASGLNHPNILTVYEIGQAATVHFIATEFVEGETLRQHLSKGPMSLIEILDICVQVTSALSAAHEANIIHRDVKPENIMIRRDGIVKVLDFGLAKLAALEPAAVNPEASTRAIIKTDPGTVVGTVSYMSPEQARAIPVDVRTDIFSGGVVLYEMVAGCLPFTGSTSSEVMASILSEKQPQPLARYSREVPTELERVASKALRKNRDERYQTIKDFLLDLKSLKQELEFAAKLERSTSPEIRKISDATKAIATDPTDRAVRTATTPDTPRAIPHDITHDVTTPLKTRRATWLTLTALVVVVATAVFFGYSRYAGRASGSTIRSIAVLPFANADGNPDTEYLSDGISESLINSLSKLPGVKVIARSSSFRYKGKETDPQEVARALGVESILTGRVVHRGDNLLISVELVNASDKTQVWGDQYNRKLADILTVQDEIAKRISETLRLRLSGEQQQRLTKRYSDNVEAYQDYLKGRFYSAKSTESGLKKSIEYFNQAIEKDPNYALAWAGLANGYWEDSDIHISPRDAMPKAKQAALKALAIDDTLAEAHGALAIELTAYDWDWANAEKEFKRAIELNPDYPTAHAQYGWYLSLMGRPEESIAELKRATELDPLSTASNGILGLAYGWARHNNEAVAQLQKTLELDPEAWLTMTYLGWVHIGQGKFSEAITVLQRAKQIDDNQYVLGALGESYALSGNRTEALAAITQLKERSKERYVSPHCIAMIYAGLGDKDQAFEWLNKAFEARSEHLTWLKVDARMNPLRSDPRFAEMMRRVGLTP